MNFQKKIDFLPKLSKLHTCTFYTIKVKCSKKISIFSQWAISYWISKKLIKSRCNHKKVTFKLCFSWIIDIHTRKRKSIDTHRTEWTCLNRSHQIHLTISTQENRFRSFKIEKFRFISLNHRIYRVKTILTHRKFELKRSRNNSSRNQNWDKVKNKFLFTSLDVEILVTVQIDTTAVFLVLT